MKTIYIVRHAKSSWEYEGIKDIDRPLKKRGINDAYLISNVLQKKIACPDVFVSSCANRAFHTDFHHRAPLIHLCLLHPNQPRHIEHIRVHRWHG